MSELRPVSEVYIPPKPQRIVDVPLSSHYNGWRYSLAEIVDNEGSSTPEGGNTVVFRIPRGTITEPVFVTKRQAEATFTVTTLSGVGKLIRANAAGDVEHSVMRPGVQVVIRPGNAYAYHNDGVEDLVLYDTAVPAYEEGDDAQLYLLPSQRLEQREGFTACQITDAAGEFSTVYVPQQFTDLVAQAMRFPDA
ncbi:MAG TPA: hypothetical protein VLG92_00200 [Candidatus Saccharimonadia bacterium]|nr:hypothetical protein [Candidatus Saccharimonadia bacterium]